MTDPVSGLSCDDQWNKLWWELYKSDQDRPSTNTAIMLIKNVKEAGHENDPAAATLVLTGAAGAYPFQGVVKQFTDQVVKCDEAAEKESTTSRHYANTALELARRRRDLPQEPIKLSNGSSQTRGRVLEAHDHLVKRAAQREASGDYEHRSIRPTRMTWWIVATVLSVIEAFLLIWPVTNAAVGDPKSLLLFAGLLVMFFIMNDQLPKHTGESIRLAREARNAAVENTRVGISEGLEGHPHGREILGNVEKPTVDAAKRAKNFYCSWLGLVVAVYAAVIFTRITGLAFALNQSLAFALLVALLITVFTAGGLVMLASWWSRGNQLGDDLHEFGDIVDESRKLQEECDEQARGSLQQSDEADHKAVDLLTLGDQKVKDGYQCALAGMQKAAGFLAMRSVPIPEPENLFAAGRPIAARVSENLNEAANTRAEAEPILRENLPFPASPVPNPWKDRGPRKAPPNPEFIIDPIQRGTSHAAPDDPSCSRRPRWRRWWGRRSNSAL